MIGHFLANLRSIHEDNVLTISMRPWPLNASYDDGPCLLQAAQKAESRVRTLCAWPDSDGVTVGERFDELCHRFGTKRVTAAIRNRILANRARRVLTQSLVGCMDPEPV